MKIKKIINELHLNEKKFLDGLEKNKDLTPEEIAQEQDLPVKAVTSAAGMLESKDIITIDRTSTDTIILSDEGKDYALYIVIIAVMMLFLNKSIQKVKKKSRRDV